MIPWTIRCAFPGNFTLVRDSLRQRIVEALGARGEGFFVALNEGVANAAHHGAAPGQPPHVVIVLRAEGNVLTASISDQGSGRFPEIPHRALPPHESEGGRGIPLMMLLADEVWYDHSTHTLWLRSHPAPQKLEKRPKEE